MTVTVLADAAFGDNPGRWPLPSADTSRDRWLRAVAAGGQGRYGNALADLSEIRRTEPPGPLCSLAHSTQASFVRQLGGHDRARAWDGRAWALATAGTDAAHAADAAADALIGLAADALGVGRFGVSQRLLRRAGEISVADLSPRVPVRLSWVRSELAMLQGDGDAAVDHAERALAAVGEVGSARHTVKSRVVLAAALCSGGHLDRSRRVADDTVEVASDLGLVPLRWALACLLADIGSTQRSPAEVAAIVSTSAETVRQRGGVWSAR